MKNTKNCSPFRTMWCTSASRHEHSCSSVQQAQMHKIQFSFFATRWINSFHDLKVSCPEKIKFVWFKIRREISSNLESERRENTPENMSTRHRKFNHLRCTIIQNGAILIPECIKFIIEWVDCVTLFRNKFFSLVFLVRPPAFVVG